MSELTFGQSIGVEPLPPQLKLGEISRELSAHLFASFFSAMKKSVDVSAWGDHLSVRWRLIMSAWYIGRMHMPVDEISTEVDQNIQYVKSVLYSRNYVKVFNFVQFVCRHKSCPEDVIDQVTQSLVECRAAYRMVDRTIVPIVSDADAEAITSSFKVVVAHPAQGPRTHLRAAAERLASGDWAGTVRESISAVESAAKVVEPTAETLGKALGTLERKRKLHGGLKQAFGSLYGYTSDADGVRHALVLQDKADVTESDAMFMFGACSAFVTYLLNIPD